MITVHYFLTASLYMVVFYGCYWVLLRRNTFFTLNRLYLLMSVAFSLILPFVELPVNAAATLPISQVTLPAVVVGNHLVAESGGWTTGMVLEVVYGVGVCFMLVRLLLNIGSVLRIIRRGSVESKRDYLLVRLPEQTGSRIASFSFGRYLVLNYEDGRLSPPALLRHEEAHIRQLHTVDIVFLEVVRAWFWFNPVLCFYKSALQEVHEFLADRAAIYQLSVVVEKQTETQLNYAQQVVAHALNVPVFALTASLATQSTLKKRLLMLQKPLTHRWALLRYGLVLLFIPCLLMCTQSENELAVVTSSTTPNLAATRKAVAVDGEIYTVVEQQPAFPGGMAQLGNYLQDNLRYPAAAEKVNAEGRVFVSFVVTKTGEVTDVKILKGIGFGTEEEATRVVSQMPRWIPARQNGQLVNVRYNLPINFQIDDKSE